MSVRERKKKERRAAILQAAEELIGEVGYSRATMEAIAERAGLGVATVYNYFGTKANILEAIIRPDLDRCYREAQKVIAKPDEDPGEAMAHLIDNYRILKNDWSNRRFLRALSILPTGSDDALATLVEEADGKVKTQIRDLLLVFLGRGKICSGLDLNDLTAIIFSVFNQHYADFVIHESIDAAVHFKNMRRRIALLFEQWKNDSK